MSSADVGTPTGVRLVVFRVEDNYFALNLAAVERVVPAAEITPLAGAPEPVSGVITIEGVAMPVVNLRRRFSLPERELRPNDQFLIARSSRRPMVLVIDEATGVVERGDSQIAHVDIPALESFEGIVALESGLVLIHDVERLLDPRQNDAIDEAMR